jgi:hypothetical protein
LVHELGHEQLRTTKFLLEIATQHASSEEAVGAAFILGNAEAAAKGGRATPTKATIKGSRNGAKGGKKGQKWWPHHVAIVTGNGGGDEASNNSDEECIAAA